RCQKGEKSPYALLRHRRKRALEVLEASRRYLTQLERKLFTGGLDGRQSPRMGRRGGIPKDADPPRLRQGFRHHLQSLGRELSEQHPRAPDVPAPPPPTRPPSP